MLPPLVSSCFACAGTKKRSSYRCFPCSFAFPVTTRTHSRPRVVRSFITMQQPLEVLAVDDYWKNVIRVCEAALHMLKVFEGKDYALVDATVQPLRQLIGKGRDFASMKKYIAPPSNEQSPGHTRKLRKISDLGFDPRANWTIKDDHTTVVHVSKSNIITCKLVTTVEQLDEALEVLEISKYIALDCEFLGLKRHVPELKVLQIAVNEFLGYAILVEEIGMEETKKRIEPILQDKEKIILGWAFGGDAQAIEGAFRGIQLPDVLDLQFKIKSAAVEQLSLANAMKKFASDWIGLEDFLKAKQLGDTFQYLGPDCVWLKNPLPPEALVYSVFDVVSLIALYERTREHRTLEGHYWPKTIISTYTNKALNKWYRNRAYNMQPAGDQQIFSIVGPSSGSSLSSSKSNGKKRLFATSSTSIENADDDPRFQADLQEAIRRSQEDFIKEKREERFVSTLEEQPEASSSKSPPSSNSSEQPSSSSSSKVAAVESTKPSPSIIPSKPDRKIVGEETTIYDDLEEAEAPGNSELHFAEDIYGSHRDSKHNKHGIKDVQPGTWDEFEVSPNVQKGWDIPDEPATKTADTEQISTPSVLQQAQYRHSEGAFAWSTPENGEMDEESWKDFVDSSKKLWDRGQDTKLDWDEMGKKGAQKPKRDTQSDIIRFNTTPMPAPVMNWAQGNQEEDDWDKTDVRPNTMIMPLKNVPKIKSKSRGPRVILPYDSDFDNTEYEEEDDGDDVSEESDASDKQQKRAKAKMTAKAAEETKESDALVDDLYLDDGKIIHMYLITRSEQIFDIGGNVMWEEPSNIKVAITFHIQKIVDRSNNTRLLPKALQLYLANTSESYTIIFAGVYDVQKFIRGTMLEKLLTDPEIVRVTWGLGYILQDIEERLDLKFGPLRDLSIAFSAFDGLTFSHALDKYCSDSPNLQTYQGAKRNVLDIENRKFSSTIWDRDKIPELAVEYSCLQGWVLHHLYEKTCAEPDGCMEKDFYWDPAKIDGSPATSTQ